MGFVPRIFGDADQHSNEESWQTLASMDTDRFGFLYRRSFGIQLFGACMGLVLVTFLAVSLVGNPNQAGEWISVPGLSGLLTIAFCGLLAWCAYQRPAWGRYLCLMFAVLCVLQSAWYFSASEHWKVSLSNLPMVMRMSLGWLGMACFYDTERLFGRHRVTHGNMRDAYQTERERRRQLARVHSMDWTSRQDRAA